MVGVCIIIGPRDSIEYSVVMQVFTDGAARAAWASADPSVDCNCFVVYYPGNGPPTPINTSTHLTSCYSS